MKLYIQAQTIGGVEYDAVIATHADDQDVPTSAYGADVSIMVVPDGTVLADIPGEEFYKQAPALSDAQKASNLTLDSADFYDALLMSPLIDWSDRASTQTPRQWLIAKIAASALPEPTRTIAMSRAETASRFLRADPQLPGMIEAVGAILPRADGGTGGLTSSEIDALFVASAA